MVGGKFMITVTITVGVTATVAAGVGVRVGVGLGARVAMEVDCVPATVEGERVADGDGEIFAVDRTGDVVPIAAAIVRKIIPINVRMACWLKAAILVSLFQVPAASASAVSFAPLPPMMKLRTEERTEIGMKT
jgi:hypothetical protein